MNECTRTSEKKVKRKSKLGRPSLDFLSILVSCFFFSFFVSEFLNHERKFMKLTASGLNYI